MSHFLSSIIHALSLTSVSVLPVVCLSTANTTIWASMKMWKISSTQITDLWFGSFFPNIKFVMVFLFCFYLFIFLQDEWNSWLFKGSFFNNLTDVQFLVDLQVTILTMFTLITLYSTIIPISLYVSIEVDPKGCYLMQNATFSWILLSCLFDMDR